DNLANGTYSVTAVAPAGYTIFRGYTINITSGEAHPSLDLGMFPIVYTGTSGDDGYTVRRTTPGGAQLQIIESWSGVTYTAYLVNIPGLTFDALGGDDTLTVDFTNDSFQLFYGILYNGGSQTTADSLVINGSSSAENITLVNPAFDPLGGAIGIDDPST